MASGKQSKRLQILLFPFFATSHIGPFTDFAVRLAAARPDEVEPTVAVTPANVSVVRSALERHGPAASGVVKIATYPFPDVDGLAPGVENLSAAGADGWRIDAAAVDETLMRPAQEALIRDRSPDAVVSDLHFFWNFIITSEFGVPCLSFAVIGAFSMLAMRHLLGAIKPGSDSRDVLVPGLPGPEIWIPTTELPEFPRGQQELAGGGSTQPSESKLLAAQARSFGLAVNTFLGLERQYCGLYTGNGYVKRAYFLGPLSLASSSPATNVGEARGIIDWLDAKPSRSVVYVCFGSLAPVSDTQLHELALGLEAAGKPFLWVVRAEKWMPPEGWKKRVGDKGKVVRAWAPQTAILGHPAVGAFVTHCGWNSVLETVAAGVPVLTWPIVFDQFINERLVTEVLRIGERVSPEGAVVRSTRYEENEVISAEAVAEAVRRFMHPGGSGDVARSRAKDLAEKAHAAIAQGGSSHQDLHRLIDHLVEARMASAGRTTKTDLLAPVE